MFAIGLGLRKKSLPIIKKDLYSKGYRNFKTRKKIVKGYKEPFYDLFYEYNITDRR